MGRMSRRDFFKHAATNAAVAGLLAGRVAHLHGNPLGLPIGSQTYPHRAMLKQDFPGVLKQLADRQLHAGPGVVHYLVSHMERSAESARRVVAALDRRALTERREIDRRLAADVLVELSGTS